MGCSSSHQVQQLICATGLKDWFVQLVQLYGVYNCTTGATVCIRSSFCVHLFFVIGESVGPLSTEVSEINTICVPITSLQRNNRTRCQK
jgi:hypothetical protein